MNLFWEPVFTRSDTEPRTVRAFATQPPGIPALMVRPERTQQLLRGPDGHGDIIDVETRWRSVDPSGHGTAGHGCGAALKVADSSRSRAWPDACRAPGTPARVSGSVPPCLADRAQLHGALRFYQVNFDTIVLRAEQTARRAALSGQVLDPAAASA